MVGLFAGNIAYKKTATSSGVTLGMLPGRAVDGNTDSKINENKNMLPFSR